MGLMLPFIETYAMDYLKKERYGKSRLYGSLGFMLIGIVLAKVLENPMIGLHFFIFCVLSTILFGYLITKDTIDKRPKEEKDEKFTILKIKYFWISLFFMQVSFGAFYNFFTIYATEYSITLEMVSYLWAFSIICEIALFYFQAPLLKLNLLNLLKFSVFVAVLRWLILYLFPESLTLIFIS